jgi:glycosyltransferase involved in cell wall biosynthesis
MKPYSFSIGYVPYSKSLDKPGDRRRFAHYANVRNLKFEIASPEKEYDLVVLSEIADISVWSKYQHGKIIYDLIDSYLAIPRTNLKQWLRGPVWYAAGRHRNFRVDYWATIQDMCRRADAVICTTVEQKNDISSYCSNTHLVLDVHSSVVSQPKLDYCSGSVFNLVWEGLPSNLAQLKQISSVLREINTSHPIKLNVLTDAEQPRFLGRFGKIRSADVLREIYEHVELHPWSESTWAEVVRKSDLAVIPIDLADPFVRGKPENKLLLLWRMGIPVLTSKTPAYARAMDAIQMSGMACFDENEWTNALKRMMVSEPLRRDAGMRGREYAQTLFSADAMLSRWDNVLESVGIRVADLQRSHTSTPFH